MQEPQPPQNYNQQQWSYPQQQPSLPNATAVLVLGICSIVTCVCYGIVGLILGIVAMYLASGAKRLYLANPGYYSESSYKNMSAGRVCAIVGLCLSGLYFLYLLFFFIIYGTMMAGMFSAMGAH